MDYSEWLRRYGVGHPVLDSCHHIFFEATEQLEAAGADPRAALERVAFLLIYCAQHFGEEEAILHNAGYPGLELHRGIHERFQRRMTILHEELERDPSPHLVAQTAVEMRTWWLQHIQTEDRKFGSYLTAQG